MLKMTCVKTASMKNSAVAVLVGQGGKLGAQGLLVDQKMGGAVKRALKTFSSFKGEAGQTLTLLAPPKGGPALVVLVGVGEASKADALAYENAGGEAYAALAKEKTGEGAAGGLLLIDVFKGALLGEEEVATSMALGAQLRAYHFDKYHTKKKDRTAKLKALTLVVKNEVAAKKLLAEKMKIVTGVTLARDLVSEPANTLDPAAMAQAAVALKELGVEVEILDKAQMEKLGMGALLGVAQGSEKPPFLVAMSWKGDAAAKDKRPLAFVGKGVTFDTGGISLKPGAGMGAMKYDMAGAAAVIGAMKALALRKAKANVVGVVGLVENMPSGKAMRPGDVVKSASGQTIEVLNTDAEGRLVLADALWYAQDHYKPRAIIDLATLTGAIKTALGERYAGLFANDDAMAAQLLAAGEATGEWLWRMPMHDSFDKLLKSPIADIKNIAESPLAGSVTAAQFLGRFVNKGTPWAHLDIAGKAWQSEGESLCPKGASGFGVRLLDRFVTETCEK
ncbi:MAG: leucyl aminopeptidase [Bdellovibrionales bacterium]|jgi:leucyl aminopeptidase